MRFFKAFNILHRRTKSATFVPGPAPEHSFAHASTYHPGNVPSHTMSASPSLLFELATAKETPIPPNFNHLADRVSGLWRPKRQSRRSSTASAFEAMEKEHSRLKDIIQFWISENTKLQSSLAQCREALLAEQQKVLSLEQAVKSGSLKIEELTENLSHHERLLATGPTTPTATSLTEVHPDKEQWTFIQKGMTMHASVDRDPQIPAGPSSKLRTIDEYASALRMTLTSRRQLREQKKIAKFWKTEALAKSHDIVITPSVSAISSIQEQPLSAGRQDALRALIIRRGQTLSLLPDFPICDPMSSSSSTIGTSKPSLPSSISNVSGSSSRLSPLASESIKAEVSVMFGSRGSLNRILYPPRAVSGPLRSLSSTESTQASSLATAMASSIPIRKSLNIDSFSDLNGFFDKTFGSASRERVSSGPNLPALSVDPVEVFELLPTDSLPCELSDVSEDDIAVPRTPTKKAARPSLKQASKDCTPRRSWQTYISRAASPLQAPKNESGDKENVPPKTSSLTLKSKQSRLPVPVFGRREV